MPVRLPVLLVATALVLALAGPPGTAAAALPSPAGSSAYVGPASPTKLQAFATWRGRPATFALEYLDDRDWAAVDDPRWWLQSWGAKPVVLGVPMLVASPGGTLAQGAAGAYDAHFRRLATALVAAGRSSTALRVGWEMNGDWFRWSAKPSPATWTAYYRRIVTVMRSVPGAAFRFDWNVNLGDSAMPAEQAYPGDAYVDLVGVDAYDWEWGKPGVTPAQRWAWIRGQAHGLDWVAAFAAQHGKRLTVPEWGLAPTWMMAGGGGGDDPTYITSMRAWARAHAVVYESYFEHEEHVISGGSYPRAATAYRAAL